MLIDSVQRPAARTQTTTQLRQSAIEQLAAGRPHEARTSFEALLVQLPTDVALLADYAACCLACGDSTAAIEAARQALTLERNHGPSALTLGRALHHAGRHDEAHAVLAFVARLPWPAIAAEAVRTLRELGLPVAPVPSAPVASAAGPAAADQALRVIPGAAGLRVRRAPGAPPKLNRLADATPAQREAEQAWWARYAQIEEDFAWVLPEWLQPPSRLRSVGAIADYLRGCSHVIDYGCGNGWLSRALASQLDCAITGVDFSAEQIALTSAHVADPRLTFHVIRGPEDLPAGDGYVFSGLLHHLPQREIEAVMTRLCERARPGARIAIIEPVRFVGHEADAATTALHEALRAVSRSVGEAREEAQVPLSPAIRHVRSEIEQRWYGKDGYGPSPLERPFENDELVRFVSHYLTVDHHSVMQSLDGALAVAGELALLANDDEALARRLAPGLLAAADALERQLLALPRLPDIGWYMGLLLARVPG